MGKKQGVKKGSAQARTYAEYSAIRREQDRHCVRTHMLDMVTLALGRLGVGEKRFKRFDNVLTDVCREYSTDLLEEIKGDEQFWYSRATLDREIKQHVGDLFVPWEQRYTYTPKLQALTNAMAIRTMSYEELAQFLGAWKPGKSESEIIDWLKETKE